MLINKAILILIFSVLLYSLIAIFTDFSKFVENLQNLNLMFLPLIIFIMILSLCVKSIRQDYLLKKLNIRIPFKNNLKIFIAGLSMLVTPGGSGELVKSHILKEKFDEPISKTIPVIFLERFHDFLGILGVLVLTAFFIFSSHVFLAIIGSSVILSLISVIIIQKNFLKWIQQKLVKIKFLEKLFMQDDQFYASLFTLFKPKPILISFLISFVGIILDGFAIYLSIISIIPEIQFFEAVQKGFTAVIVGLFSLLPAGIGVTEVSLLARN